MSEIKEGDKVSWSWGSGQPGGTAAEVAKEGEISITSKKGNEIKKKASPDNPAVHIERPGNDVVKRASELQVDEKGSSSKGGAEKKDEGANGEASAGEKRKAEDEGEKEEEKEEGKGAKKAKKGGAAKGAKADAAKDDKEGEEKAAPKKKGRPAKAATGAANGEKKEAKGPAKKKEPKKAQTESGEPRRSGRNKA
ncbi:hypothetical protein B0A48_04033 [Cryoendolithus antarcticus]|uniref:Hypervirulence associated protein TUDOR domain-containing protein n=1 Tax=Cryoendolithus antarcticus TaxID=1507870 RepID=A0A1V8TH61_9PEZI|nr:hypothetical protein B0A48_04033 [Cryoendolithus antarcticus]